MERLPTELSKYVIDQLVNRNFGVIENALSAELLAGLRACFLESQFRPARVGREGFSIPTVRNDEISWIDETDLRGSERQLFSVLENLRLQLNEDLFLGLVDFEAHYARYEAGHFYARHVDRFNDDSARTVSVVLYLNESWSNDDGGQLRLHTTPPIDIKPDGGTLVCFASDKVEHEVLPSKRTRISIAAWFRRSRK